MSLDFSIYIYIHTYLLLLTCVYTMYVYMSKEFDSSAFLLAALQSSKRTT